MNIGIDFGTSYTKLGVMEAGLFRHLSEPKLPSVFAFDDRENQLYFNDLTWELESDFYYRPNYKLDLKRNRDYHIGPYSLPSILQSYFTHLKDEYFSSSPSAHSYTLSVPNYFGLNERKIILETARAAFQSDQVRLLPEPVSALTGYNYAHEPQICGDILCIDIGGGTSDFSFLHLSSDHNQSVLEAQLQSGSDAFSGLEIDRAVLNYIILPAFQMQSGQIVSDNLLREYAGPFEEQILKRWLALAEKVKIEVSAAGFSIIDEPDFYLNHPLYLYVSDALFEQQTQPVFDRFLTYLDSVLKPQAASLGVYFGNKWQMDHVLLLGGASRCQGVSKLIQRFFNGVNIISAAEPEYNVVKGLCAWNASAASNPVQVKTIYPFNFYIETAGHQLEKIPFDTKNLELDWEANYKIFSISKLPYYNTSPNPDQIAIKIYEMPEGSYEITLEKFTDQELVLNFEAQIDELPESLDLYFDLKNSCLSLSTLVSFSSETNPIHTDDTDDGYINRLNQGYELLNPLVNRQDKMFKDFGQKLQECSHARGKSPDHNQIAFFRVLTLLKILAGKL